ncbi:hypothetical protein KA013_04285 [Patescibacteria group bacterium]|nr:hypothetical protein [Patescibacteria group bacterium]
MKQTNESEPTMSAEVAEYVRASKVRKLHIPGEIIFWICMTSIMLQILYYGNDTVIFAMAATLVAFTIYRYFVIIAFLNKKLVDWSAYPMKSINVRCNIDRQRYKISRRIESTTHVRLTNTMNDTVLCKDIFLVEDPESHIFWWIFVEQLADKNDYYCQAIPLRDINNINHYIKGDQQNTYYEFLGDSATPEGKYQFGGNFERAYMAFTKSKESVVPTTKI